MKSRRDFLKLAAAAGAAWPLASCGGTQPKTGTSEKKAAAQVSTLSAEIVGAFAYVFDGAYSRLVLASVKQPAAGEPGEKCDFVEHSMGLSVGPGVRIQTQLEKRTDAQNHVYYMCPQGDMTFQGIAATEGLLSGFNKTNETSVQLPQDAQPADWNDLVWLPKLGEVSASGAWKARTASRLTLDKGKLTFRRPGGTMYTTRWTFVPNLHSTSNRPELPMIQSASYDVALTGNQIEVLSGGAVIATLSTDDPVLNLKIGTPAHGAPSTYRIGDKVSFYSMFWNLLDSPLACADRPIPTLTKIIEGKDFTDGDWCPSGHFVEH